MRKTKQSGLRGGFTLVEMLVVIGIIGLLAATLIASFSYVKIAAKQSQAHNLVMEVATAMSLYVQQERDWPEQWKDKEAVGMDQKVCWVLQDKKLFDVTTYTYQPKPNETRVNNLADANLNWQSLDRFGLLDPWGRAALRKNKTKNETDKVESGGTFADHRLQFRLDKNLDGMVDSLDNAPPGVEVRASVIVWSRGPNADKTFEQTGEPTKNNRCSWPVSKYKNGKK